jgi:DNA-nicking Smr family endonuclease
MAKKKPKTTTREREPELPKFGGFQPLAAMLGDIKSKVDAEKQKEAEARKAAGKPPPPPPKPVAATARPSTDKRGGEKAGDQDDELAFHRMMSGVTPLAEKSQRVAVAGDARVAPTKVRPAELREKAAKDATAVLEHLHHLVDDAVRFEVTDDGRRVEGRRLDASPQLVRELRRGALPIDARLDLHGLGAEAAREKLLEFLRAMRTRGERCVLVIHGKGDHSPGGGIGVLRGEIAAWLSQGRAREHVAAFATAHAEDGGEGAVYVALRR